VRVVDFTEGAQGPFAASLLADLGAEVVKVERPAGELMRHVGPFAGGLALPMLSIARGRHASLSIDVKAPAGRSTALQLVAAADLLIQNWKPGTDAKLGLSWEEIHAINPRLVYVRASGYGPHGPFGSMGAMDSLSSAIGGLSSLSGDPAGRGERMRTPILDFVSAFVAAEAALVGLAARRRHGRGRRVAHRVQGGARGCAALLRVAGAARRPHARRARRLARRPGLRRHQAAAAVRPRPRARGREEKGRDGGQGQEEKVSAAVACLLANHHHEA
jgi:crotonobetainyl-CoA:carnitine CoA-transferase CaiB-like acyl-CoA transferase